MAPDTRERILRAAVSVIREFGSAGATTRAIAEAADVAEGSIYRNFADKNELIKVAVLEYLLPEFVDLMRSLPARVGTETPATHVKIVVAKALSFYRDVMPMWTALAANVDLRSGYLLATRSGEVGPHLAIRSLANYLSLEQKKQRIPASIDCKAAAQMLLGGALQQAFFSQLVGPDRMPLADGALVNAMVKSLLGS